MLKLIWHTDYSAVSGGRISAPDWPEGWPVPRVGDEINRDGRVLVVRHVIWYPAGEDDDPEPFVYIVLRSQAHRDGARL